MSHVRSQSSDVAVATPRWRHRAPSGPVREVSKGALRLAQPAQQAARRPGSVLAPGLLAAG
jgi:hypothetical protein